MIRIIKTAILVSIISISWVFIIGSSCGPYPPNTKASIIFFGDSITYGRNDTSNLSDYPTYLEADLTSLSWLGFPYSYPGCKPPTQPYGYQQGCIDNAAYPGEHAASPCSLDTCPASGDTSCTNGLSDSCNRLIARLGAIPGSTPGSTAITTLIYWEGGNDLLTYGLGTQPPHPVFCDNMGNMNTPVPSIDAPPFKCLRKRIVDCLSAVHNTPNSNYSNINIILGTYYQMDPSQWAYASGTQCVTDVGDKNNPKGLVNTVPSFNRFIAALNAAIYQVKTDLSQVGITVTVNPPDSNPASNLGTMPLGHICSDVHPSDYGNKLIASQWCNTLVGGLWGVWCPAPPSPPETNPCPQ